MSDATLQVLIVACAALAAVLVWAYVYALGPRQEQAALALRLAELHGRIDTLEGAVRDECSRALRAEADVMERNDRQVGNMIGQVRELVGQFETRQAQAVATMRNVGRIATR